MKNPLSHFEIYADNPDALARFYTSLFDWTVTPVPGMDYQVIHSAETDAQGMLKQPGAINGGMPPSRVNSLFRMVATDLPVTPIAVV